MLALYALCCCCAAGLLGAVALRKYGGKRENGGFLVPPFILLFIPYFASDHAGLREFNIILVTLLRKTIVFDDASNRVLYFITPRTKHMKHINVWMNDEHMMNIWLVALYMMKRRHNNPGFLSSLD